MYPMYPYYSYQTTCKNTPITFPPQHQDTQPGLEYMMVPRPISDNPYYRGNGKLYNKIAIITGGDSGIGRAVAIGFAKEGADVVIAYLYEHIDAEETKRMVERFDRRCLTIAGDLREEAFSRDVVQQTMDTFGKIDILVLNQGVQYPQESILNISTEQLDNTFRTNIYLVSDDSGYVTGQVLHVNGGIITET